MSEEKGELAENSSSELPPPSEMPADVTALSRIEARLAQAQSAEDVVLWNQVRREIIRQDEIVKDGNHRRFLEKVQVFRKLGLSVTALTIGTVLVMTGYRIGIFLLGVALYELVLDVVGQFFPRGKGRKNEDDPNSLV